MIVPVPVDYVERVWEDIAPYIQMALDVSNGEMWLEDVFDFLKSGKLQAAMVVKGEEIIASMVTEVVKYPRKTAIRLILAGGSDLKDWGPELNQLMEFRAKEIGAELIEVQGRPGWKRYLEGLCGAKVRSMIITRNVHQ